MKQVNYNLNPTYGFVKNTKKDKDEVSELLKEKAAEKAAEKAEVKAEEIVADKAIQKAVEKNESMQILANINKAMVSVSQSGVPHTENDNIQPSDGIAAPNNTEKITSYEDLVEGWDAFIRNLQNTEPEAYNAKLTMINNIIALAEREDRADEANMWRCRRYIMKQNYTTALLRSYNSTYPNGKPGVLTNPLEDLAELGLSINDFLVGPDSNVEGLPNPNIFSYINIQNFGPHCGSSEDLAAVNSMHGEVSWHFGLYSPNEDPEQEYLFDLSMISFFNARIQALRVRINQVKNDPNASQYVAQWEGWINTSQIIVQKFRNRINSFESLYDLGPGGMQRFLDGMNIQGLTPVTAPPAEVPLPSEQIPSGGRELAAFYENLVNKYETLYGEVPPEVGSSASFPGSGTLDLNEYIELLNSGGLSAEKQLILSLIISAIRLGNQTAAEYWIIELGDLDE